MTRNRRAYDSDEDTLAGPIPPRSPVNKAPWVKFFKTPEGEIGVTMFPIKIVPGNEAAAKQDQGQISTPDIPSTPRTVSALNAVSALPQNSAELIQESFDMDFNDLINVFSMYLETFCRHKDSEEKSMKMKSTEPLAATCFDAVARSLLSIKDYLSRIRQYSEASENAFVLAFYYLAKLSKNKIVIRYTSVHHLIISSILIVLKFFDDSFYNNAFLAKVGGIPPKLMNSLEVNFLALINFDLYVSPDQYRDFMRELYDAHKNFVSAGLYKKSVISSPDTKLTALFEAKNLNTPVPANPNSAAAAAPQVPNSGLPGQTDQKDHKSESGSSASTPTTATGSAAAAVTTAPPVAPSFRPSNN